MTRRFRMVIATMVGAFVAVVALMGVGRLLANALAASPAPTIVNYQGYLTNSGGNPISGTATLQFSIWDASTAGNQVWNETHNNVPVAGGYFSVFLGSQGTPLTPSVFSSDSRYLEVAYNGTTFARQRFASVPYALVASEAISATYATTATYVLNGGSSVDWSHVVVVAKSGGDYTTVTGAMNAITPSSTDRYLVLVMPGVYEEQVELKEYVHLKGAGMGTTFISSAANTANHNDDAATTMIVPANTQVSDLTVRNTSATNASVGMKVENGNSSTILNNVKVEVITAGGTNRRGINVSGGNGTPQFTHLYVEVSGATSQNWGIFVSASSPQIHDSKIDATGSGSVGLRINVTGSTIKIDNSVIDGSNASNGVGLNSSTGTGTVHIDRSSLVGDGGGFSLNSTDNYDFYVATSLLGGPASFGGDADFICVFNYDDAYTELDANCQ